MTLDEVREIIDEENGTGFSENFNLKGCYILHRNDSFIAFKVVRIEGIKTCVIKYIHYNSPRDLISVLAYSANFWIGNKIDILIYFQKARETSPIKVLEHLGFVKSKTEDFKFKSFDCNKDGVDCKCTVWKLFK